MVRHGTLLAAFFIAAALVWWPLDAIIFAHRPEAQEAYAWMRGGVVAANSLILLALWRFGPPRRFEAAILTSGICLELFWATSCLGATASLGDDLVAFFYLAPFLSLAAVVPPRFRLAASLAMAAAVWLGFYLRDPGVLTRQNGWRAQSSYLAFCAVLAAALGHVYYGILRSDFVARRRLAAREAELEEMARSLQSQVDAQTAELRRLTGHIDDNREEERRWIAAELHDELGQQLAAMRLAVDFGRRAPSLDAAKHVMRELHGLLDRTHESVRRILRAMRPRVLDDLGLTAALRWLARDVASRSALDVEVSAPPHATGPEPRTATVLFRCAQEALTNCVRHANASRVAVILSGPEPAWSLSIEDDGAGLPHARVAGLGMAGIRERVARLGGKADWRAGADGGTRLDIVIPAAAGPPATDEA